MLDSELVPEGGNYLHTKLYSCSS